MKTPDSHINKGFSYTIIIISVFLVLAPILVPDHYRIGNINPQRLHIFAILTPVALLTAFIISLFKPCRFHFNSTDMWLLLFCGYWFLLYYISGEICPTTALILLLLTGTYFLIRFLLSTGTNARYILFLFLYLTGITEVIWGIGQLSGLWNSFHMLYKFTGSFFNPGPYSGLLATLFPIALWQSLTKPAGKTGKLLQTTGLACSISVIILLPASMIRSSWLAALLGSSLILLDHYSVISSVRQFYQKKKVRFFLLFSLSILIATVTFHGMYTLKKNSADGRLLIWKVSAIALQKTPLTGQGPGSFSGIYGKTQACYFSTHPENLREKQVAGTPEYGFNEYLQISVELGLIGLALFAGLIISAFRQALKQKQTGILGGMAAFLVFAFFSYPFSTLPLSILFFILLACCTSPISSPFTYKKRTFFYLFFVLLTGVCIIAGYRLENKQKYLLQWKKEKEYFNMAIFEGTVDHYRQLYPRLKEFSPFLFEYGQCLAKTGQYQESTFILSEGIRKSSDPMFYNIIGKNEQALGNNKAAETAFLQAFHQVPHRLYPLYLLARLYVKDRQYLKAKQIIKEALKQKPKIMSPAIENMQNELKKLYEQIPS